MGQGLSTVEDVQVKCVALAWVVACVVLQYLYRHWWYGWLYYRYTVFYAGAWPVQTLHWVGWVAVLHCMGADGQVLKYLQLHMHTMLARVLLLAPVLPTPACMMLKSCWLAGHPRGSRHPTKDLHAGVLGLF